MKEFQKNEKSENPLGSTPALGTKAHRNVGLFCFCLFLEMNEYFVYAIKSLEKNYIYVGITNNPERRFEEHNSGKGRSTKPYAPFRMIYLEKIGTREEARNREKYLKSGAGKEFLKQIINS